LKGLEIKDLPFSLRAIVASDHVMGESKQDILLKSADAIEELVAAVPKWISVEERLPHYLDHVLCVNKYGIQMVGYLTDYKEGGFRCESGMDSCDYITHWMPLPVPPKEVLPNGEV